MRDCLEQIQQLRVSVIGHPALPPEMLVISRNEPTPQQLAPVHHLQQVDDLPAQQIDVGQEGRRHGLEYVPFEFGVARLALYVFYVLVGAVVFDVDVRHAS